ncbi:Rne/Rng family ribonuclease [Candidatus Legionella polyplacis]|uniref:Ribonuclease G n=1 Tax=Candidatus Legionella polyplacis TaxID=2005262 RepID=A0ABZ2GWL1_9GAMM
MEKILINAIQNEEIRVALIKNNYLYDLDIECPSETKKKGNIYKAIITRIEPSLNAVFVTYGSKKQGFLPLKEILPKYLKQKQNNNSSNFKEEFKKYPIHSLLEEKQELLVQVNKEERGNKGAALTTYITLAGCYLVLMPDNPKSNGISRRIEGEDRENLKEIIETLKIPKNMSIIIRTAGFGKKINELQSDLNILYNQWKIILKEFNTKTAPCLIHQEGDIIIRSIRDNLYKTINDIIIDNQFSYIKAKKYIEKIKPELLPNLKLYNSSIPLFTFFHIESQIETAYQRKVLLPSGGSLIIDRTEALVSIDINSSKSTSGTDIEDTALNTNLEAAHEIARQLRLRDLSGLIVIDFIDMYQIKNQREVENCLRESLKTDRARIQIGHISRFGLLEMSRQRLRLSLGESSQEVCPKCEGRGTVRNIQSYSLSILRLAEEEALKEKTFAVKIQLPAEIATFIFNEKREFIQNIEKRHEVKIIIISSPYLEIPQYIITKIFYYEKNKKLNYSPTKKIDSSNIYSDYKYNNFINHPTITSKIPITSQQQKNIKKYKKHKNLLKRFWYNLFNGAKKKNNDIKQNNINITTRL